MKNFTPIFQKGHLCRKISKCWMCGEQKWWRGILLLLSLSQNPVRFIQTHHWRKICIEWWNGVSLMNRLERISGIYTTMGKKETQWVTFNCFWGMQKRNPSVSDRRKKCLGCSTSGHGSGRARLCQTRSRNLWPALFWGIVFKQQRIMTRLGWWKYASSPSPKNL